MTQRLLLACPMLGLVFFVVAPAPPPTADPPDLAALAKARLNAVERFYQLQEELRTRGEGPTLDMEGKYTWSCRWLDAQRDVSGQKTAPVAALETHLARMKEAESLVRQRHKAGEAGSGDVITAEFFRLEAEFWLAQAHDH